MLLFGLFSNSTRKIKLRGDLGFKLRTSSIRVLAHDDEDESYLY